MGFTTKSRTSTLAPDVESNDGATSVIEKFSEGVMVFTLDGS
jgi:hypothetical protein